MNVKDQADRISELKKEREKREEIRKEKEEEIKYAYQNMSDQTKLIVDDILDMCRLKDSSFILNELQSINFSSLVSYREGQRSIAMMINDRMENL